MIADADGKPIILAGPDAAADHAAEVKDFITDWLELKKTVRKIGLRPPLPTTLPCTRLFVPRLLAIFRESQFRSNKVKR
jgi:hypothetical protein